MNKNQLKRYCDLMKTGEYKHKVAERLVEFEEDD